MVQINAYTDDIKHKSVRRNIKKFTWSSTRIRMKNKEKTKFMTVSEEAYKQSNKIQVTDYYLETVPNVPCVSSAIT
jgi:hypothetical protein